MAKKSLEEVAMRRRAEEATRAARAMLDDSIDVRANARMKRVFGLASASLSRSLRIAWKGHTNDKANLAAKRKSARLVSVALRTLTHDVAHGLESVLRPTLIAGASTMLSYVQKVAGSSAVIDMQPDDEQVRRLVDEQARAIENERHNVIQAFARHLMQSTLTAIDSVDATDEARRNMLIHEMIANIEDKIEAQWFRVERLAGTETSAAFNLAQDDMLSILGPYGSFKKRWTEHVRDFSLKPMDAHTGQDSIEMHGQLAELGGRFTMSDIDVSPQGAWYCPPNRPNDRAILTPWSKSWGIPGWVWQGDEKVYL